MMEQQDVFERDLFEIDNAKHLQPDELAKTFICTEDFWKLLSAKNHVVIGSRGSGKTAIVKMISHQHLSNMSHPKSREIIKNKEYIGIYQHTDLDWVSGLKNKIWLSGDEEEIFFQWAMNVSSCIAFIDTVKSCLNCYIYDSGDRIETEASITKSLIKAWLDTNENFNTLKCLSRHLENQIFEKQSQVNEKRSSLSAHEDTIGNKFNINLFGPLKRGIKIVKDELNIPDKCIWIFCLDEAEFLNENHHRIINSHLRSSSGNFVLKITTMPYCHYTQNTNINVPLNIGDDFEYLYIDNDPILSNKEGGDKEFGFMLFHKRIKAMPLKYKDIRLSNLLGDSILLADKNSDWDSSSKNMKLLMRYCNQDTIDRAISLTSSPSQFKDQISRKLHGALLLRDEVALQRGRKELTLYSGDLMTIRCGDNNPRRLIRIFNKMLSELDHKVIDNLNIKRNCLIQKDLQSKVLQQFSKTILERVQAEPNVGPELYKLINTIGNYMHDRLHAGKIGTDQVTSIEIDDKVSSDVHKLIKVAISIGLLYPNNNSELVDLPVKNGKYRLAYVLCPYFKILPRKGKSINLNTIINYKKNDSLSKQLQLGI